MLTFPSPYPRERDFPPFLFDLNIADDEVQRRIRQLFRGYVLLDSSAGLVEATDVAWWPVEADSSSVVIRRKRELPKPDTAAVMPTASQISLVVHTLGFNKRQLGEVFGVTRQAVYDWLKGGSISPDNRSKLLTLARLLVEISADTRRPLYHRFTTEPIVEGERSVLELLRSEPWDTERLSLILRKARNLTSQRAAREAPSTDETSSARDETNLLHNILSSGPFSGP